MAWRRSIAPFYGAVLCGLLAACGSGGPPAAPGPTDASPPPAPLGPSGFLHVLVGEDLTTYRIDPATGRLQATVVQPMGDVHQIAGEPKGRFVYMAYGPRSAQAPYGKPRPSIVAYAPRASDGALSPISEGTSDPIWRSSMPVACRWTSLSASVDRVHAMWITITYHDAYYNYVTHPVGPDGQIGPDYDYPFEDECGGNGFVDGRANLLYKQGCTGVTAHVVGIDGHLTQTGDRNVCVSTPAYSPLPIGAARGLLLARAFPTGEPGPTVCTYEGPGLAPRANLGFAAGWAEALVPVDETVPAQIAIPVSVPASAVPARHELRLYGLCSGGELQIQGVVATTDRVDGAVFHPAGRFLFASVGKALEVYTFRPEGGLTRVESVPSAGGRMAVTVPRTTAATGAPY